MSEIIRKSFDGITKSVDETKGIVEAVVNSTGIEDMQRDVMEPGCWDGLCRAMKAGEENYPSILWGHDWAIPVGKVLDAEELMPGDARLKGLKGRKSAGGLRIVGQYNLETQRGREAFSDVKNGVIKHWSVGFMPADDGHEFDAKGVHHISKVGIWPEVSNVLVGASPGTHTTVAKTAEAILADREATLDDKSLALEQAYLAAIEEGEDVAAIFKSLLEVMTATEADQEEEGVTEKSGDEPTEETSEPATEPEPEAEDYVANLISSIADEPLFEASPQHSDPATSGAESVVSNWGQRFSFRGSPELNSPTPEEFLPT